MWDGEWTEGTGRSTGEECEQVFSYLSRCSNTTKYQRPENREETLTEMMMIWNKRKISCLAEALFKKFKRVKIDLGMLRNELRETRIKLGLDEVALDLHQIVKDVQNDAIVGRRSLPKISRQQAVLLLYNSIKPSNVQVNIKEKLDSLWLPELTLVHIPVLKKKIERRETLFKDSIECFDVANATSTHDLLMKDIIVPAFQIAIHKASFEKAIWNTRLKKVADSSKHRFVYRKKLSKVTDKINLLSKELSKIDSSYKPVEFQSTLSDTDKRLLAETYLKMTRSEEELVLLKEDMESYLTFYTRTSINLKKKLNEENCYDGRRSLLLQGLDFVYRQLSNGLMLFCHLISPEIIAEHNSLDTDIAIQKYNDEDDDDDEYENDEDDEYENDEDDDDENDEDDDDENDEDDDEYEYEDE